MTNHQDKDLQNSNEKAPEENFFRASASDFKKIPGSPVAYWVSEYEREQYSSGSLLSSFCYPKKGLDTGENDEFLRMWYEVQSQSACFDNIDKSAKWYPYNKGGDFRRWYGNREYVINWQDNGIDIKSRLSWKKKKPTIRNPSFYFQSGFSWTTVSSSNFSARFCPEGSLFDNGGCTLFSSTKLNLFGAYINSIVAQRYLEFLAPTLNFQPGNISKLLFTEDILALNVPSDLLISNSKQDWDSYETSWGFKTLSLLQDQFNSSSVPLDYPIKTTLNQTYDTLNANWQKTIQEMQALEEENNKIFIDAYGLQDELEPDVPLKEITLTCNPHYRYGDKHSQDKLDSLLLTDTIKEFLSYAVGCMFGRYSLDKEGLVLANQGETLQDYLKQVNNPSFDVVKDNVIAVLDEDWFEDDITERFLNFLKITFGEENYHTNLQFIEDALGKDVRKYFVKDFYNDHVKTYKKRPIYWMFSSPKASFNVLIYLHRYQSDTLSVILNDYLREFSSKLKSQIEHFNFINISADSTPKEKTQALKKVEKLKKVLKEIEDWEHDILYPLATNQIEIDLDDGVKVNYKKFGKALKKVAGLS